MADTSYKLTDSEKAFVADARIRLSRGEEIGFTPPNEAHPSGKMTIGEMVFGETTSDWQLIDAAKAIINLPGSALGVAGDVAAAVWSPWETTKALGQVGMGAIIRGAEDYLGVKEGNMRSTEYKVAFENFMHGMSERYGGWDELHRTMVNDPAGFLLDVSPLKAGLLKVAGRTAAGAAKTGNMVTRTAKDMVNMRSVGGPLGLVQKGAEMIGGLTGSRAAELGTKARGGALRETGAYLGGLGTGLPDEAIRLGIEAGAVSKSAWRALPFTDQMSLTDELAEFRKAARELRPVADIHDILKETMHGINAVAGEKISKVIAKLDDIPADIGKMRNTIRETLRKDWDLEGGKEFRSATREFGGPTGFVMGNKGSLNATRGGGGSLGDALEKVQKSYKRVMSPEYDGSLRSLHDLALQLRRDGGSAPMATGRKIKDSNTAIGQMEKLVRDHIKDLSPEFAKESLSYAREMLAIEQMGVTLSGYATNAEVAIQKVMGTMAQQASKDFRRGVLDMVKARTGHHLAEMAAGSAMSQWAPAGLHAKSITLGVLGGITGLGITLSPAFFLGLPAVMLTMPRLWAEFAPMIGLPMKYARKLEKFSGDLRSRLPGELLDTSLNIGTIINRMIEEGIEPPPFPDIGEETSH